MLADYLAFTRAHPRPVAFAFLLCALSSFGQTFFIALSGAAIRLEFTLSDGALGSAYAVATIASGLALGWVGRWIDRLPLRTYVAGVAVMLAAGCMGLALASQLWMLTAAFFLLRLAGQGLMTHTALTATARRFPQDSGKALGLVALGFALGEAVLPPAAVALQAGIGWRGVWWVAAGMVLLGTVAALGILPATRPQPAGGSATAGREAPAAPAPHAPLWRDRRLLLALPAVLAPSFVVTGFFFHQVRLAAELGWDLGLVAAAFVGFAIARAWAMLRAGPVIDRTGAARLLPLFLAPLALAMGAILLGEGRPLAAVAYLLATGLTTGVSTTLATALWTEFFGPARLAALRAAVAGAGVIASALAPAIFGALLDLGITLRWQAAGCLLGLLAASAITLPLARGPRHGP